MSVEPDMRLTLDEFNHLFDMKGNCKCKLCKKYKILLNDKLKEWDDIKRIQDEETN